MGHPPIFGVGADGKRLDADLLRWFRRERGYQTRINAILRAYMQAHREM